MPEFDAAALDWRDQYKLMIGSVTPRPIALVTTLGANGPNAAPFSFFNPIGRLAGKGGYTRIADRFEMPRLRLGVDID